MSYCRFSDSDAYIYDDVYYGLYCSACSLMPTKTQYNEFFKEDITIHEGYVVGYDYNLMLEHVAAHRENGDYIPDYVDERLIFERDCIHEFNDEAICKHCWNRDEEKRNNI